MPKYLAELDDGRKFEVEVEGDQPPTEAEIVSALGTQKPVSLAEFGPEMLKDPDRFTRAVPAVPSTMPLSELPPIQPTAAGRAYEMVGQPVERAMAWSPVLPSAEQAAETEAQFQQGLRRIAEGQGMQVPANVPLKATETGEVRPMTVGEQRRAGITAGVEDIARMIYNPANLALMLGGAGLAARAPKVAQALSTLFRGLMVHGAGESAAQAYLAQTPMERWRAGIGAVTAGGFALLPAGFREAPPSAPIRPVVRQEPFVTPSEAMPRPKPAEPVLEVRPPPEQLPKPAAIAPSVKEPAKPVPTAEPVPAQEKLVSAAIRVGGKIFTGSWHGEAYDTALKALGLTREQMNRELLDLGGFITDTGRYVDRFEAAKIARKSGQFKPYKENEEAFAGALRGLKKLQEPAKPVPAVEPVPEPAPAKVAATPVKTTAAVAEVVQEVKKQTKVIGKAEGQLSAVGVKQRLTSELRGELDRVVTESGTTVTVREGEPNRFEIQDKDGKWLASVDAIKTADGTIKASYLSDKVGRGRTVIAADSVVNAVRKVQELVSHAEGKVTIEIPGDGTFTVYRNGRVLQELLGKVQRLKTGEEAGRPPPLTKQDTLKIASKDANDAVQIYGTPQEALEALQRQQQHLEAHPENVISKGQVNRLSSAVYELEKRIPAEPAKGRGKRLAKPEAESGRVPLPAKPEAVLAVSRGAGNIASDVVSRYSEPILQRMATLSGEPTGDFQNIASRAKLVAGDIADIMDTGLKAAGGLNRATTWLSDFEQGPHGLAVSNLKTALERPDLVPAEFKAVVAPIAGANRAIGQMAERASPTFRAGGKMQQNWTEFGQDLIAAGPSEALTRLTRFLAEKNHVPFTKVAKIFADMRAARLEAAPDVARIEKINQDFRRTFQIAPTHIKIGGVWSELVHSSPQDYLREALKRTAHAVAFREKFPVGTETLVEARRKFLEQSHPDYGPEFDTAMRALQGHPQPASRIALPTNPFAVAVRTIGRTIGNVLAKSVLSGNFPVNLPETFMGGTQQFLGMRGMARALVRAGQLYKEMELTGRVNKLIYDWSYNPRQPFRSAGRIAGNAISKVFAENVLNEVQEFIAAVRASIIIESIKTGTLTAFEKRTLPQTFKIMGFTEAEIGKMMGGDQALLDRFGTQAAPFLNAGNMAAAEGSLAYNNRLFNTVFRFQSYPMMKVNQLWKVMGNLADAVRTRKNILPASEVAARFIVGTTLQGAATALVTSLATGGVEGLKQKWQEAKDEPLKFLADSAIAAIGGPLYMIARGMERGLGVIMQSMFPVSMTLEMSDVALGMGAYTDLALPDRINKLLFERFSGGKIAQQVLSIFGLSQEDTKLMADMRAFRRWKSQTMGWRAEQVSRVEDESAQFRMGMKRAMRAMSRGESVLPGLLLATGNTNKPITYGQLAASLRGRQIVRTIDGGALSNEQMAALTERIGEDAVKRLTAYDAKIDILAQALTLAGGEIPAGEQFGLTTLARTGERLIAKPATVRGMQMLNEQARLESAQSRNLLRGLVAPPRPR